MRIQHNIMAMNAYRNYTNNVSAMKSNLEKLSSGYKINRAGDDAAGLAISEKMRAQISGLKQAQNNAKSGINLVQTAEGALTEVHDMLNRMVTLAEQSANGTYDNDVDRVQLQKEVEQLRSEINRIADSSNFNGINLLDGSMSAAGVAATTKTFGDLPPVGTSLGTSTVLHKDAAQIVGENKNTFSIDLHNLEINGEAGNTFDIKIGETTLTGTLVATTVNATDIANALGNGATDKVTFEIGGTTYDKDAVSIAGGTFKATNTGTRVTFTQDDADTNTVNMDLTVKVEMATARAAGPREAGPSPREGGGTKTFAPAESLANGVSDVAWASPDKVGEVKVKVDDVTATNAEVSIAVGDFKNGGADATPSWANNNTITITSSGGDTNLNLTATYNGTSWTVTGAPTGYTATFDGTDMTLAADDEGKKNITTETYGTVSVAFGGGVTGVDSATGTLSVTDGVDAGKKVTVTCGDEEVGSQNIATAAWTGTVNVTAGGVTMKIDTDDANVGNLSTAYKIGEVTQEDGGEETPTPAKNEIDITWTPASPTWADGDKVVITSAGEQALNVTAEYDGTNWTVSGAPTGYTGTFDGSKLTLTADENGATGLTSADFGAVTVTPTNAADNTLAGAGALTFTDGTGGEEENGGSGTSGASGDYNVSTTVINSKVEDTKDRLASTYFTLSKDMIAQGNSIKIGTETYTFKVDTNGSGDVDVSDLDSTASDYLTKVAERLTNAASANDVYTVGHDGNRITVTENEANTVELDTLDKIKESLGFSTVGKAGKALTLQIGDTNDSFNKMTVDIKDLHADAMGIGSIDISTQEGASDAMTKIKEAINYVSDVRGDLGATQNRLDHTINNLSVMTENIQDAESTIRDVDVAEEMMEYTKNNILIQSAQAMLAQANQVPQGVLQLLG